MNKRFVAILVILVAVFVGLFVLGSSKSDDKEASSATPSNHIRGGTNTKVTLLEYGDFQCPACGGYYPIIKELESKYGDSVTFQFRHFPLVSLHPNAMSAHRAAEAASNQNKFWEMHDLLYERQESWSSSNNPAQIFEQFATELNLDIDKYKADIAATNTKAVIDADIAAGKDIGADSTPTFVLNGKKLDNPPRDVAGFSTLIDEILNAPAN